MLQVHLALLDHSQSCTQTSLLADSIIITYSHIPKFNQPRVSGNPLRLSPPPCVSEVSLLLPLVSSELHLVFGNDWWVVDASRVQKFATLKPWYPLHTPSHLQVYPLNTKAVEFFSSILPWLRSTLESPKARAMSTEPRSSESPWPNPRNPKADPLESAPLFPKRLNSPPKTNK